MAFSGKPGSPGMGKLVIPSVYISFLPWLLEVHFWSCFRHSETQSYVYQGPISFILNFIVFEEDIGLKVIDSFIHSICLFCLSWGRSFALTSDGQQCHVSNEFGVRVHEGRVVSWHLGSARISTMTKRIWLELGGSGLVKRIVFNLGLTLFYFHLFFIFSLCRVACELLAPGPRIRLVAPALGV